MSDLQRVFVYCGNQLRTVTIDGSPWWVAKDVCDILEHTNSRMAVDRLDDDEKGVSTVDTLGGPQEMQVVNEPGLYALIMTSRKPEAKDFRRWITHDVIPSIRKTGSYGAPSSPTEALLQAVQIMAKQEQQIREINEAQAAANQKLLVLGHRVDIMDAIDTIGDLQQRLNAMVRKYAHQTGATFSRAWSDFVEAFNNAYRTNLELLKTNYKMKHGLKSLTTPQYLSMSGKLEDAIRVVDKLLNKSA